MPKPSLACQEHSRLDHSEIPALKSLAVEDSAGDANELTLRVGWVTRGSSDRGVPSSSYYTTLRTGFRC